MASSKVIITGASGLLGSSLLKTAPEGVEIYSKRFDILSKDAVYSAFDEAKPDTIIHCAGDGRVDFAENNHCAAWRINVEAVETLWHAAFHWNTRFVLISSNAIYDGNGPPYYEHSFRNPVNFYGATKRAAEVLASSLHMKLYIPALIIRPIFLYGWSDKRDNFVTRLYNQLQTADLKSFGQIPIADDIYTQPTYAPDCASAIWKFMEQGNPNIDSINISSKEKISLFKFAIQIAKAFDLDSSLIVPAKSEELKGLAPRPKDTTFDISKLEGLGIECRGVGDGLKAMREEKNVP